MRHLSVDTACRTVSDCSESDGSRHKPPRPVIRFHARFSRFSLMLGVYAAVGTAGVPLATAAASRHPAHAGHSAAPASVHGVKPGRSSRALVPHTAQAVAHRSGVVMRVAGGMSRPAHPGRSAGPSHAVNPGGAVRSASAMHRGLVPLANTTWDDPAMPPAVLDAIQTAAHEAGVDPRLLTAIAWRESRFDPNALSRQSSARGLLQFTSGTWLRAVRDYGSKHDAADYAAAIRTTRSGDLVMPDKVRSAILDLRSDPILSAKLAADSMKRERVAMAARLGRRVTSADLYLMHVLGPTGAMRFLEALNKQPRESSLKVASPTVMRNAGLLAQDGQPMTVANTYAAAKAMLDSQYSHSAPLLATAGGAPGSRALASAAPPAATP